MKIKILLWSVVSIFIIGFVATVWWLRRPQVITFSDGSTVTLLGTDYGKVHMPPNSKARTASTNQLHLQRSGTSFVTDNDELVIWVRQVYPAKEWHNFQFYLYDKAGTACVENSDMNYDIRTRQNNRIVGLEFSAFPRRQGKFLLAVQEQGNGGQEMADQKFIIRNPARGSFSKWAAEPLPATKEDDDLSVTLTKLVVGADTTYNRNQDNPDDPVNKGVQAVFQVQRNGKTVSNWQPVSVEMSDGSGNRITGSCNTQWNGDEGTTIYQWGLWPDEPAWKIKFEFSQQSDFADSELWTAQRIQIQPGTQQDFYNGMRNGQIKAGVVETDLNGVHLKIFPAKQFTDVGQNANQPGGLTIQADPALPDGMRMAIVKLTDDQGNDVSYSNFGTMRNVTGTTTTTTYRYGLRDITGATNLNLTIALHQSHFIEFTAKPEKSQIP